MVHGARRPDREIASRLLAAALDGDDATLAGLLPRLCGLDGPATAELAPVVVALIDASAEVVHGRPAAALPGAVYSIEMDDEAGHPVHIDEVEPAVRALVRAVLARLNGRREDMWDQLDLVVAGGDAEDRLTLLVHALVWAAESGAGNAHEPSDNGVVGNK